MRFCFLFFLFCLQAVEGAYRWPTSEWPSALPTQVGADPAELERFLAYVFPDNLDWNSRDGRRTEALVIIKDGYLIYERYEKNYGPAQRHLAWSMTKMVLNALVGISERKGLLKLEDPIQKYLPAGKVPKEIQQIRVKDLLAWSSGIKWNETYEYNPLQSSVIEMLYSQPNIPAFVWSRPLSFVPGSHFNYSSGDSNLLMRVLRGAIGEEKYSQFPWVELFDRVGMKSAVMERDDENNFIASSYLHITPRDMAKLGLLFLNDGVWNKERILPQNWVFESTQIVPSFQQTPKNQDHEDLSPGYHLWVNRDDPQRGIKPALIDVPTGTYAALGHWGQSMWMIPSSRIVVVRMADDRDKSFSSNRFLRLLLNSFGAGAER